MDSIKGYQCLKVLATGNRFQVFKGKRLTDNQEVILKTTKGEQPSIKDIATLQHEYKLLKKLNHSHIIQAYELIKYQQSYVLVLENFSELTLKQYLANKPLLLEYFFPLAFQLTQAVAALHQQGVIHKDINPNNILIDPTTMTLKLIDLSNASEHVSELQNNLNSTTLEGTLPYISPEQTGRTNQVIDYRSDFYSLGITFYEMLAGHLPFHANDPLEWVHNHLAKVPLLLSEVNPKIPPSIASIVAKLLAKTAEDRYLSAAGLLADLKTCASLWKSQPNYNFVPGQQDISDQLQIPQKLYGREEPLKQLQDSFDAVCQGSCQLVFVTGYSGIGKTSLIRELYKPITQKQSYFITGKFDQLERSTPYSAFITAFEMLIKTVLAENESTLQFIREDLNSALGNNGQVLIEILPKLELIIGPQPAVPAIPPTEAYHRLMFTLQRFISVFTKLGRPVIIFLDDLQWADNASIKLMETLLTEPSTHSLLIIGAYRDNEVTDSHPLAQLKQSLAKTQLVTEISLQPLSLDAIKQLLADTFRCSMDTISLLSELILEKTQGNPFFINEFLSALYQEKQIHFDVDKHQWTWNIDKIKQLAITQNVVDLLVSKLQKLPQSTQTLLKLAACMGYQFELGTLATISERDSEEIMALLSPAIEHKMIILVRDTDHTLLNADTNIYYQFIHDRIQQAAYALIDSAEKEQTHYKIGQLLLKDQILQEHDEKLFPIVGHFNQSLPLITSIEEKYQLARYNLWAGKKAKTSAAYATAYTYLKIGCSLLTEKSWNEQYELSFNLYRELVECEYLNSHFQEAEQYFDLLIQKAKSTLEKVDVYSIKIALLSEQGKHIETIKTGLIALRLLGIKMPFSPKMYHILFEVIKIKKLIGKRDVSKIDLPIMTDPYQLAISKIFSLLSPPCYESKPLLLALLTCKNISISLKFGYSIYCPEAIHSYTIGLIHMDRFKEAECFIQLGNKIEEKLTHPIVTTKVNYFHSFFINHWWRPAKENLTYARRAYLPALEAGDLFYAGINHMSTCALLVILGHPLSETFIENNKSIDFLKRTQNSAYFDLASFEQCYILFLLDEDKEGLDIRLNNLFNKIQLSEINAVLNYTYYLNSIRYFLLKDYVKAFEFMVLAFKLKDYTQASFLYPDIYLLYGLSICKCYNSFSWIKRLRYQRTLKSLKRQFKIWAEQCSENYLHKYLFLSAEMARLQQDTPTAMRLYSQAIEAAQKEDYHQWVGIINECAGEYYLEQGINDNAKRYIHQAHYAYTRWEAKLKVRQLEEQYSGWFHSITTSQENKEQTTSITSTGTSSHSLDYLSILKSTQAISGEIELSRLLKKLLAIVVENAGAQRGVLLSFQGSQWLMEAEGTLESQHVFLEQPIALEQCEHLPKQWVQYVIRTKEPLLLSKDSSQEHFDDPYLIQYQPKSLLVLPIIYQGNTRSIIYLENNSTQGAFTHERIEALQLLGSQAAISLENARLYHQATHDPLTKLANRNLLYQTFNYSIARNKRNQSMIAVMFIDLDNFKKINDTLGHEVGDQLLLFVAQQLKACAREGDLAVRLGGDEFLLILENIKELTQVQAIAEQLFENLKIPLITQGKSIPVSASVGISYYPQDGDDIVSLLKHADIAMYKAKERGKNNYQFYHAASQ